MFAHVVPCGASELDKVSWRGLSTRVVPTSISLLDLMQFLASTKPVVALAVVVSAADDTAFITSISIACRAVATNASWSSVFSCRRRDVVVVGDRTWCQTQSVQLVKFSPLTTPSVKSWTLGLGTNESRKSFRYRPQLGVLSSFVLPTVSAGRCCGLYIPSTVLGDGFVFVHFGQRF